jgi:erlin
MHIAQQRSRSDAEFYQMQRLADSNRALLTPQYLELRKYESIAQNNKIFYGSEIPNMFVQGGCELEKFSSVVAAAASEQKVET